MVGMSEITQTFHALNESGEGALVTYLMAGDPDSERTVEYIGALADGGADIVELGVPFTDPVADGPTIQEAEQRALRSQTTLEDVFAIASKSKARYGVPIILMSYFNPVYKYGIGDFMQRCSDSGVNGLIVPDVTIDEAGEYLSEARERDIDTVFLAAPNTAEKRLVAISRATSGFLYLVARYGTTGAQSEIAEYTRELIGRFSKLIPDTLPLGVGFGLSSKEQIREVINSGAEGVIVGSCVVEKIARKQSPSAISDFVGELKDGTR